MNGSRLMGLPRLCFKPQRPHLLASGLLAVCRCCCSHDVVLGVRAAPQEQQGRHPVHSGTLVTIIILFTWLARYVNDRINFAGPICKYQNSPSHLVLFQGNEARIFGWRLGLPLAPSGKADPSCIECTRARGQRAKREFVASLRRLYPYCLPWSLGLDHKAWSLSSKLFSQRNLKLHFNTSHTTIGPIRVPHTLPAFLDELCMASSMRASSPRITP